MIFKTIEDETTISGQRIVGALRAREISQQQATVQLETDIACLKKYEIACKSGSVSTEQFDTIMKNASITAKEYTANIHNGTGSAQSYAQSQKANNTALQSVGVGASIASKAVKALSVTMNTIATTALFSLFTKGISWVTEQIDNYIRRNEIAMKKSEELLDTFKSEIDTITSNQDKINGYTNEFEELAKGVDNLGRNVSLTADEYSRYQSIVKEIVGINPSLISGYDEENNILADKNGLIETSIQLLKDEYNQKLKNLALPNNIDTAIEGAVGRYNTAKEDFLEIEIPTTLAFSGVKIDENGNRETGYVNQISQYIEDVIGVEFTGWEGGINQYILNNAEAVFDNLDKIRERASQTKDGWEGLNESQLIDLMDYFKELRIAYNDMNSATTSANPTLQYVAMAEDSYSQLTDIQKKFIADYINGIQITSGTTEQEKDNIRKSIISLTQELSDLDDVEVNNALADLYAIPTDEQSIGEFVKQFRNALEIIKSYCSENGIEIPISITDGEKSINELEAQQQHAVDFAKDKFNGYDPTDFFKENVINTQEEIDKWLKIAKAANSAADAEEKYVQYSKLDNDTDVSFQSAAERIHSLTKGFDQLSHVYADLTDGESFDYSAFLNNDQFVETFGNLTNVSAEYKDAYDDFIESVSNSNGVLTSDAQSAFNKLAAAYIEHQSILNDVTEATRDTTVAQLEQMGVSNASAVIDEFLNVKKQKLAYVSGELKDATYEEIQAMFATQGAASVAGKALAQLALEKLAVDGVKIDSDEDIDEIIALANAAGSSALVIAKLEQAKKMINSESDGSIGWLRQYEAAERTIKEIEEGTFDFQIKLLNADDFKYTSDINSLASAQENLADSTEKATDALEKQKSVLEGQKSEYESLHSAVLWFYDEQIEAIDDKIEAINEENEALEKQLETMDDILKAIEDNYDAEIQKIQDKIDALQDSNDEEERALKLEEAKRKLREAKSRKTVLQYEAGKGFVYTVDTNAVKEAEEELEALQDEEVIHQLENEIDKLEEAKQKWLEIPEVYEKAMRELAAANYFGSDWRTTTLFPSDELFNSFKGGYIGNQEQISVNEERIEKLEQDKSYIESLKETWEEAIQAYENQQNRARLAAFFGSDYEYQLLNNSIVWQKQFVEEYSAICTEIEAIEERIKSMNDSGADLSNIISAFGGGNSDSTGSQIENQSSGSTEESSNGSGLLGAVEAVDEALGSSDNPESLIGKVQALDDKKLPEITSQFGNRETPETGEESGSSLLSAVNAVSNAIVGGKDDKNSLMATLTELNEDSTLKHIIDVADSFGDLLAQIQTCLDKIGELASAISALPPISGGGGSGRGGNGGSSGGSGIFVCAKGGIISRKSAGDFDHLARAVGEDHTIAVQEGEAIIPKESVTRNKELVLSLIDGKELAIDTAAVPDTSALPSLARTLPKGITWNQIEFVKSAGLIPQFAHNVPAMNHELFAQTNNQHHTTTVQFHGDMIIQGVQDAEGFAKDVKHRFANIMTQELNKR